MILVNAFVTPRLDNCNSLPDGLPRGLLHRLITACSELQSSLKFRWLQEYYIMPLLRDQPHWLPVEHHITFKSLLITFKALNNLAPCYTGNLLHL